MADAADHDITKISHSTSIVINDRREAFCQGVASGMTQTDAYIAAGYTDKDRGKLNAGRLYAHPIIQARIKEIKQELLVQNIAEKRAHELTLKRAEREKIYNLDWVLLEAKDILVEAKNQQKFKDALAALDFIADLLGYKPSSQKTDKADKPGRKKDANRREPGDPENHTNAPQVNVSILNQIAKRLDDSAGSGDEEGPNIIIEATANP